MTEIRYPRDLEEFRYAVFTAISSEIGSDSAERESMYAALDEICDALQYIMEFGGVLTPSQRMTGRFLCHMAEALILETHLLGQTLWENDHGEV